MTLTKVHQVTIESQFQELKKYAMCDKVAVFKENKEGVPRDSVFVADIDKKAMTRENKQQPR
jgi:hypothetical protein